MSSLWRFSKLPDCPKLILMTSHRLALLLFKPPPVVNKTTDLNWPAINVGENYFEKALANGALEGGEPYVNGVDGAAAGSSALDDWAKDEEVQEDIPP
jgi:coatomer protein complex subunit alpha (xenin)